MPSEIKRAVTIAEIITWSKADTQLPLSVQKQALPNIWMDSRLIKKGDIFLALKGDLVDGHKFVEKALNDGAIAAIVSKKSLNSFNKKIEKRLIVVPNPLTAIAKMATAYRKKLDYPFIAITGSNGKTTTRIFIQKVISKIYKVGITEGNWNNNIGVPLSILRLTGEEDLAIIEMGTNHPGEIKYLSNMVKPDVAIITNVGYAHIGNFGSLNNIAEAKLEITSGLSAKTGLLILNGDDKKLVANNKDEAVFFGSSSRCGIKSEKIIVTKNGDVKFRVRGFEYKLAMPGRHFVNSALPAIFLAIQIGISEKEIAKTLLTIKPEGMRGLIRIKKGVRFIVDCYNANPSSMETSLTFLSDIANKKDRVAIVGDMLEMGSFSSRVHNKLGETLYEKGINRVIAVGIKSELVIKSAIKSGLLQKNCYSVKDSAEAINIFKKIVKKTDTVLLKGSRTIALEQLFERF